MKTLLIAALVLTGCGSRTTFTKVPSGCTTVQTSSGAQIKCDDGTSSSVVNGQQGERGSVGNSGANGRDGVDLTLKKGLKCSVYDSAVVNRNNGLISILANATPKFTKVIELFDVGDSLAANGFPKFTAAEQALIGTEDYALDCDGYINIPVSNNYSFKLLSDDNARLVINNVSLINMDVLQPPTWGTANSVLLYKGLNKINILYYQGPLTQIALKLQISGSTSSGFSALQDVPSTVLFNM
jgi:PA14 domain